MVTYKEWEALHPAAAADFRAMLNAVPWPTSTEHDGRSEAWAQQRIRMQLAQQGAMGWRNNVGVTPAKCPDCGAPRQPIRYGLANDSSALNAKVKSSDIIAAIPRLIRPQDVGTTIAQFGSIEAKRPGWVFSGTEEEQGQASWHGLILRMGGFAAFSTGDIKL